MPKPALTAAQRRVRTARRAWIPAIVGGAVILVVVAMAIFIQVSGIGKPLAPVDRDSTFNPTGIQQIRGALDAQIDVRGVRSAKALGLPSNAKKSFGPYGLPLEVDLVGANGAASLYVDKLTLVTRAASLRTISTSTREFGFSQLHSQLYATQVLGITDAQLAKFQDEMPDGAASATSRFTLSVGVGTALGVPTRVTATCAGPEGCEVITTTTLATH